MKNNEWKYFIVTMLSTVVILMLGYTGIIVGGNKILNNNLEAQTIDFRTGALNLFYSKVDDDIELYPWNLYTEDTVHNTTNLDIKPLFLEEGIIEAEIFYSFIAIAANITYEEVITWYKTHETTVLDKMVYEQIGENTIYFYQDKIILNDTTYEVKISCNDWQIISFTCIPDDIGENKDSDIHIENKEKFMQYVEKEKSMLNVWFTRMKYMCFPEGMREFVYLYDYFFMEAKSDTDNEGYYPTQEDIFGAAIYKDELIEMDYENAVDEEGFQIVELKDCFMLLKEREKEMSVAIYYDVFNKRVVGFHYFIQQ